MKEKRYGTLGSLEVPVQVYSEFKEVINAAGSESKAIDILNDNLHYRGGPAAATREAIVTILNGEDLTVENAEGKEVVVHKGSITNGKDGKPIQLKMKTTDKKDEKGQAIMVADESEGEFVRRFMSLTGKEDLSHLQPIIDKWARSADAGKPLAVDAKTPERKPKTPPKLSEEDKTLAGRLVDGQSDIKKFAAACAKYGIEVAKITGNREADVLALGWNVRAWGKAVSEEAKAKAKAAAF